MSTLSDPTPVRLLEPQTKELKHLSESTGVDVSKLVRLAVKAGLPTVIEQFGLSPKSAKEQVATS